MLASLSSIVYHHTFQLKYLHPHHKIFRPPSLSLQRKNIFPDAPCIHFLKYPRHILITFILQSQMINHNIYVHTSHMTFLGNIKSGTQPPTTRISSSYSSKILTNSAKTLCAAASLTLRIVYNSFSSLHLLSSKYLLFSKPHLPPFLLLPFICIQSKYVAEVIHYCRITNHPIILDIGIVL